MSMKIKIVTVENGFLLTVPQKAPTQSENQGPEISVGYTSPDGCQYLIPPTMDGPPIVKRRPSAVPAVERWVPRTTVVMSSNALMSALEERFAPGAVWPPYLDTPPYIGVVSELHDCESIEITAVTDESRTPSGWIVTVNQRPDTSGDKDTHVEMNISEKDGEIESTRKVLSLDVNSANVLGRRVPMSEKVYVFNEREGVLNFVGAMVTRKRVTE